MSPELGRILVVIGIVLVVVGGLAMLGVRLALRPTSGRHRHPGERGTIYIPLGTMLVVSVVLTVVFSLIGRR
jgi:hypothetical protein